MITIAANGRHARGSPGSLGRSENWVRDDGRCLRSGRLGSRGVRDDGRLAGRRRPDDLRLGRILVRLPAVAVDGTSRADAGFGAEAEPANETWGLTGP